jgi:hypothetical protein
MSDDHNILQTIIDNPGIKAKEIARVTGLSRKHVYEALNGVLIENVISDDKVRWYPKINRKNSAGYPSQKNSADEGGVIFKDVPKHQEDKEAAPAQRLLDEFE